MDNSAWAKNVAEKINNKMLSVAKRNQGKIPYLTDNGIYQDMAEQDIYWWTNGFWGGIMWQLYYATGEELYRTIALDTEIKLEKNLHDFLKRLFIHLFFGKNFLF